MVNKSIINRPICKHQNAPSKRNYCAQKPADLPHSPTIPPSLTVKQPAPSGQIPGDEPKQAIDDHGGENFEKGRLLRRLTLILINFCK